MNLSFGVKQDQSFRTVENAGTSPCYRISPTQNFSSRLRRTPKGQHKPLKPLGLWDAPNRFMPSPQKIVLSPRKFTEDPLCDVQEPSERSRHTCGTSLESSMLITTSLTRLAPDMKFRNGRAAIVPAKTLFQPITHQ